MRKAGREGERERDSKRGCDQAPWRAPSLSAQTFKKKKKKPPLSVLRQSPPPPFAPSRAQEFPTLLPNPLKVLPKHEEDKKVFEQWSF